MTYTVEPTDHWKAGDRAYCIRGLKKDGRHLVELGRIYEVEAAKQWQGMMNDGLDLVGVDTGGPMFCSNRFICLRGSELTLRQIAARTRHGWLDAYRATGDARNAAHRLSA